MKRWITIMDNNNNAIPFPATTKSHPTQVGADPRDTHLQSYRKKYDAHPTTIDIDYLRKEARRLVKEGFAQRITFNFPNEVVIYYLLELVYTPSRSSLVCARDAYAESHHYPNRYDEDLWFDETLEFLACHPILAGLIAMSHQKVVRLRINASGNYNVDVVINCGRIRFDNDA